MLTVTEFSKAVGFSRQTVLKWIKERRIEVVRGDKEYRIPDYELERVLKDGIGRPGSAYPE